VSRAAESLQYVNHDIRRRVGRIAEQLLQIAACRFKGDVGGADFLQICVGHSNNRHPERSAAKSKDPAELLNITHRDLKAWPLRLRRLRCSSTFLGMTSG
jgi:hypothetical protein